jgi:hypothetical protein
MSQYKVNQAFELDGALQEVGAIVELSDERATEFADSVEKVAEPAAPEAEATPSGEASPAGDVEAA